MHKNFRYNTEMIPPSPSFLDALASLKTMLDIKWLIHSFIDVFKISRLQSITEYYRVLQSFSEFFSVLQSTIE